MNNQDAKLPEDDDEGPEIKWPRLWGSTCIGLGILGVIFCVYSLVNSFGLVPLYGTVTASVLIGALSIFLIFYGFRVFNKDY